MNDRWSKAFSDHRAAVDRFIATAESVDPQRWTVAPAPGAWSPAEISQHIILTYEVGKSVISGKGSMRSRAKPWMQTLLRWILLPHILFHRSMPLRAKSPREVRPEGDPPAQDQVDGRLRQAVAAAERELDDRKDMDSTLRHPYFGELRPLKFFRLLTVHIEHHRLQIERIVGERTGTQ